MRGVKWARRLAVIVAASALVAVGVLSQAKAAEVTQTGSVAPGESVTLQCPAGEQYAGTGTADFWRKLSGNQAHYLGSAQFVASGDGTSATAGPAPKGSRFYSATINCEPIPTEQTVIRTGIGTGENSGNIIVECPSDYPYLVSVQEVTATYQGSTYIPGYTVGGSAVSFSVGQGVVWRVVMTCSSEPPTPTEQVVTQTGRGTGSSFSVNCPADYRYLRSVFEVVVDNDGDFSTTYDQRQPDYTTTETGVDVQAVSILNYWRVSLYCSSLPQH